jgi:hypothetical protein
MLLLLRKGVDQDANPPYRPALNVHHTFFAGSGDLKNLPPRWFVLLRSGKICCVSPAPSDGR